MNSSPLYLTDPSSRPSLRGIHAIDANSQGWNDSGHIKNP